MGRRRLCEVSLSEFHLNPKIGMWKEAASISHARGGTEEACVLKKDLLQRVRERESVLPQRCNNVGAIFVICGLFCDRGSSTFPSGLEQFPEKQQHVQFSAFWGNAIQRRCKVWNPSLKEK